MAVYQAEPSSSSSTPIPQPSVFDAVVAVDAGVDHLFRHGGVTPEECPRPGLRSPVHARPGRPARTAIFVGGSNVSAGEAVLEAVRKTFFGPFQVSVLFDANGSNTTAAAAVLAAIRGQRRDRFRGLASLALAGTGPVGQRIARLLGRLGATGRPRLARPRAGFQPWPIACTRSPADEIIPFDMTRQDNLVRELQAATIVINSGPAGVQLLPASLWQDQPQLKAMIDLNAVPPLGIEGVEATDKDKDRSGVRAWGALGVGGTKMKIHKKAIQQLFVAKSHVLDAEEVLELVGWTIIVSL